MRLQRNVRTNFTQRLSHAIAGDATADGEYLSSKRENFLAYLLGDELFAETPRRFMMSGQTYALCA
jgi:hypothetical protein